MPARKAPPAVALTACALLLASACQNPSRAGDTFVRVTTPAFSLQVPAGWHLRFDSSGALEAFDPKQRGRWADKALRVLPFKAAANAACSGELVALKAGRACVKASEGGGSHSVGTTVEASTPTHHFRLHHNVPEGETPTDLPALRTMMRHVLESFDPAPPSPPLRRRPGLLPRARLSSF